MTFFSFYRYLTVEWKSRRTKDEPRVFDKENIRANFPAVSVLTSGIYAAVLVTAGTCIGVRLSHKTGRHTAPQNSSLWCLQGFTLEMHNFNLFYFVTHILWSLPWESKWDHQTSKLDDIHLSVHMRRNLLGIT